MKVWLTLAGALLAAAARAGEGVWTSFGPESALIRAIAIDPGDAQRVYAAVTEDAPPYQGTISLGTRRGSEWEPVLEAGEGDWILSLVADGGTPGTLYAFDIGGKVWRTRDGGATWDVVSSLGRVDGALALSASDPGALYLAGEDCNCRNGGHCPPVFCGAAVLLSRDGGASFGRLGPGPGGYYCSAFAADPLQANVLYAGTNVGLFATLDGGATWNRISAAIDGPCPTVSTVAVDPHDEKSILVGFFQSGQGPLDAPIPCGAAYASDDGGATWRQLHGLPIHVTSFVFGPAGSRHLYAAAGNTLGTSVNVYRSNDGGERFDVLADGLQGRSPQQLASDPAAQQLYVSTDRGVFDLEVLDDRTVTPPHHRQAAPRSPPDRQR